MLDRLSTCLFHPRMIGKFLNDSFWKICLFIWFIFTIAMVPYIATIKDYLVMENSISTEIINKAINANKNLNFDGNKLVSDGGFIITEGELEICFLSEDSSNNKDYVVFEYNSDSVSVKINNLVVSSYKYSENDLSSFSLGENDFAQRESFREFLNFTYKKIMKVTMPFMAMRIYFYNLFIYILIIGFSFLINFKTNPILPSKIVLKVAIYSITISLVIDLIAGLFNVAILSYLGMILAPIYAFLSLKSIVKIQN